MRRDGPSVSRVMGPFNDHVEKPSKSLSKDSMRQGEKEREREAAGMLEEPGALWKEGSRGVVDHAAL